MPRQLIKSTTLDDIADAIREKLVEEDKYYPKDMPDKIRAIAQEVGITDISELVAAVNYVLEKSNKVTGEWTWDECIEHIKSFMYKGRLEGQVTFFDFDGTIIAVHLLSEIRLWTEEDMPLPPVHPGLIFQEWNYTLKELQDANMPVDVGATYTTIDTATHIVFSPDIEDTMLSIYLDIPNEYRNNITINWGDDTSTICGTTNTFTHLYHNTGEYEVSIKITCDILPNVRYGFKLSNTKANARVTECYIGDNASLLQVGIAEAFNLKVLSLSKTAYINGDLLTFNYKLQCIVIPKNDRRTTYLAGSNFIITTKWILPEEQISVGSAFDQVRPDYGFAERICIPSTCKDIDIYAAKVVVVRAEDAKLGGFKLFREASGAYCPKAIYIPPGTSNWYLPQIHIDARPLVKEYTGEETVQ